jgi:hypothetical protein
MDIFFSFYGCFDMEADNRSYQDLSAVDAAFYLFDRHFLFLSRDFVHNG